MDKDNKEVFGFQFWSLFMVVSGMLLTGGLLCTGVSVRQYLANGKTVWLAFVVFGLFCFIGSIFCLRLFPKWAKMVRNTRLSEERLKGVIGASNISQYIQADEERGRNLMDSISQKQEEVGRNIAKRMDSRWDNTTLLIRKSNEMMEALRASLADVNKKLASMADPAELEKYKREAQRLEKENRMLRESEAQIENTGKEKPAEIAEAEESGMISEDERFEESLVDGYDEAVAEAEKADADDQSPLGFTSDEDEEKWKAGEEDSGDYDGNEDVSTYW